MRILLASIWRNCQTGITNHDDTAMASPTKPKQNRIGARVPPEVCETLCHAAALTGATVNQFLVQ